MNRIKNYAIRLLGPISDSILRARAVSRSSRFTRSTQLKIRHVILAPSSVGNLGDEAMLTSTIDNIRKRSPGEIVVLTHRHDDDWSFISKDITQVCIQGYFSAASWPSALNRLLDVLRTSTSFCVLGADVMDGAYSTSRTFRRILMLELSVMMGVDTIVLGFSFSDKAAPESTRYLAAAASNARMYARDPLSYERLEKFISTPPLQLAADTAFLLKPSSDSNEELRVILQKLQKARVSGSRIIAFNSNPLGAAMSAGADRGNQSVKGLDRIVHDNVVDILELISDSHLVFISHDAREPHNDARLLENVASTLPAHLLKRVTLATRNIGARDVKRICEFVDLVVTGRMHLGIAALGSSTPCYFLDFQGKVKGLLQHFGTPELSCDWATYSASKIYAERISHLLDESLAYRQKLSSELPRIKAMSELNFEYWSGTA